MSHSDPTQVQQSPEQDILDDLDRILEDLEGRLGVCFNLSKLLPHNRRDYHIRMARNSLEEKISGMPIRLFQCRNGNLICLSEQVVAGQFLSIIEEIKKFFETDPLVSEKNEFAIIYELKTEFTVFNRFIRTLNDVADKQEQINRRKASEVPYTQKIETTDLQKIEEKLSTANLASFVRQQSIYTIIDGVDSKRVSEEIFISIRDLGDAALPGVDLLGDKWLFQALTKTLDKRMLVFLTQEKANLKATYSLNLNVATILTEEFQKFDRLLPADMRQRLIIELQFLDVFADMEAYRFARQYLQSRGYRICLDGVTHHTIPFIDRKLLLADLLKMIWSPTIISEKKYILELKEHIERQDISAFIMCRCDSLEAIEIGKMLKIPMFQGYHVDKLVRDGVIGPKANQLKKHKEANQK